MNATIVPEMNIPNMDTYWSILKNLSSDMKLELISRLSKSLLSKDQSIDDMKKYLLDTSICVFLFRRKYGIVSKRTLI